MATAALTKSEKRLNDIIENALVGISIVQEGRSVYRNPELRRLIGEVGDRDSFLALPHVHPDDRLKVRDAIKTLESGRAARVEIEFRFYPHANRQAPLKWVYCRATRID